MLFGFVRIGILSFLLVSIELVNADGIDDTERFIAKVLVGIKLTTVYQFSFGQNYPPIDQDVTFWCTKPAQHDLRQTFFNDSDIKSKVDFTKPVNFVIHGWLGGLHGGNMYSTVIKRRDGWMRSAAVDWAHYADCNVCAVDWSRLANYCYSIAAMRHTKIVTNALVGFMQYLIDNGIDIEQVSIAGHSLGAQIAGCIGRMFSGKLNAIYGLDRAGPLYTAPFDVGTDLRLDPSDARYVQCILTSRDTLGTSTDCGHANFIVNGGSFQPGCLTLFCSHSRAHDFFKESLDPSHALVAEQCTDVVTLFFKRVILGQSCSKVRDRLGIHCNRMFGRFFLETASFPPFILRQNALK